MKKIFYLMLIPLLFSSCSRKELTKDEALKIISQYYHLPSQTEIAIDKIYDDYGWPPQRYNQLAQMGIFYLKESTASIYYKRFEMSLTEKGKKYWVSNGIMNDPSSGRIRMIIFKGYLQDIKDISISSNTNENTAKVELILKIYNVSPIQEIFSPLQTMEIKKTINFKLFNDGWKILEDVNSKNLITTIVTPLHWMGGWRITYDNSPIDFISSKEINNIRQANERAARKIERIKKLKDISKNPTRTIDTFQDINHFTGQPRYRATILTDVGVDMVGSNYDSGFNLWFGELKGKQPYLTTFTQTAMGWNAPCVSFGESGPYVVFKDKSERDRFYKALTKALSEWRSKYWEVQ